MLHNATLLMKSTPWPPNISDEHVCCIAPATRMHLSRSSWNVPRLPSFLEICYKTFRFRSFLARCRIPATRNDPEREKVVWTCCAFNILTWKCASRQNGVHFCDSSIPKSAPKLTRFVHFDFDMCFAPQRRALLIIFIQLPKVLRDRQFLTLLTWKCASRHSCVQFFISHLARWLRTCRFSFPSLIFFSLLFSSLLFSSLLFSSLLLSFLVLSSLLFSSNLFSSLLWLFPPLLFNLSILSEVWLLNFLRGSTSFRMVVFLLWVHQGETQKPNEFTKWTIWRLP